MHSAIMSVYVSEYPTGVEMDPAFKAFFERFYEISDTPDAHEEYAQQFTADAKVTMASKKVNGTAGKRSYVLLIV